jgi:hypothetical protein
MPRHVRATIRPNSNQIMDENSTAAQINVIVLWIEAVARRMRSEYTVHCMDCFEL